MLRGTKAAGLSFSIGPARTNEVGHQIVYFASHFIDDQWDLYRMVTDALVIVPNHNNGPLVGVGSAQWILLKLPDSQPLPRAVCSRHKTVSSRHRPCREEALGTGHSAPSGRQRALCREPQ
jgi:hypothetical protein